MLSRLQQRYFCRMGLCLIQWLFVMLSGVFQKAELLNHINPELLTQTFLNCGYKLKNVAKSKFRQLGEHTQKTNKKKTLVEDQPCV